MSGQLATEPLGDVMRDADDEVNAADGETGATGETMPEAEVSEDEDDLEAQLANMSLKVKKDVETTGPVSLEAGGKEQEAQQKDSLKEKENGSEKMEKETEATEDAKGEKSKRIKLYRS